MTNTQIMNRYKRALAWWLATGATQGLAGTTKLLQGDSPSPGLSLIPAVLGVMAIIAGVMSLLMTMHAWKSPSVTDVPVSKSSDLLRAVTALQVVSQQVSDVAAAMSPVHEADVSKHDEPR